MKVIFLDFDGVLNSYSWWMRRSVGYARWSRVLREFDPLAVAQLNRITARTGASIVASSSWRDTGRRLLRRAGVTARVIGCTPELPHGRPSHFPNERPLEILAWLNAHPGVASFLILDDCPWNFGGYERLRTRSIRTNSYTGLTAFHVDRAVGMLGEYAK